MALERGLKGRDQLLKLVQGQAREIQERHRAGLQLGKPYTSHGSCLLLLYRDVRGTSYQKESGINSIQLGADGFRSRQGGVRVAFLGDQLAPHFGRCQAGIQTGGAELGISLALAIDDGLYIRQEVGEMLFRTFPSTPCTSINTDHTTGEFVHTFANGHPPPPQFARSALWPTWSQFFDGASHKQATGAALERLCSLDQQGLERVGQFHRHTSSMRMPGV